MQGRKLAGLRWDRCRTELIESAKHKAQSSSPRSESEIMEAGRRAALLIPPNVGTILFEYDDPPVTKNGSDSFPVPPPPRLFRIATTTDNSNGGPFEEDSEEVEVPSSNPLTSLLGYSMDDSPTHAQRTGSSDNMDKEVASFMEELESSGLLGEEEANGVETSKASPVKETPKPMGGGHVASSATEPTQPAEQKVIGEVAGAPDWHRVLDSGSGTTYFWNSSTDEVSWDPPPGVELPDNESDKSPTTTKPITSQHEENGEKSVAGNLEKQNGSVPAGDVEDSVALIEPVCNSEEVDRQTNDVVLNKDENGGIPPGRSSMEDVKSSPEAVNSNNHGAQAEMKDGIDKEEGELAEEVTPSSEKVTESQALWSKLSETVKAAKDGAGEWYDAIPEAVRLAIMAETHLDHWMYMTGQLHESGAAHGEGFVKFWGAFEQYVEEAVDQISKSIPGAVAQMGYSAGQATEADPSISSQNQVVQQPTEYQWNGNVTTYVQDWSAYAGVGNGAVHLPPLPTEPVPPLPPDSDEEPPPPPPGTDDVLEVQDDDADVSMDLSDGEGPDLGVDSVHSSATVTSSASHGAPAVEVQHGYAAPAELQDESSPHVNGEAHPVEIDSQHATECLAGELETHKGINDRKRKIDKIAGSGMGLLGKNKKISKASKTLSKLMNQWQAVKQEERRTVSEEDPFNAEAVERKKVAEMEEWRLNQLRSGQAEHNANFQPLKGDWRAWVKKSMPVKASGSPPKKTETSSVPRAPDIVELTKGLPEGWKALVDNVSGEVYYGNVNTRETVWERP